MDVKNTSLLLDASIYSMNKAKDIKNDDILSALGMTPQTQKAQDDIDNSIKQSIGQGVNIDIRA